MADKAKFEARKKELAARHEVPPTTYEITLKLADQPGLPPAMTNLLATLKHSGESLGGASSTNNAAASTKATESSPLPGAVDPDEEEADEPGHIATDVPLKEAERILLDLIQLSAGKAGVAARLP